MLMEKKRKETKTATATMHPLKLRSEVCRCQSEGSRGRRVREKSEGTR